MTSTATRKLRLPATDRYEFQETLGTGGVGTVYRALDRQTGELVAIKVLRYKPSENQILHQRIVREFRAASELEHPNIVRALAFETDGDIDYLVFELVEGGSLGDKLEECRKFSEAEAIRIITQVGQALEYAHSRGVIHRDVKPDNVLVLPDGRVKLTDFGLAKTIDADDDNLTRPASGLGTPQFMAPEQFASAKTAGVRSDVYSLGVTLYNLITGRLPFDGKNALAVMTQKEYERYPSAKSLVPGLSERVDAAITAALKPNPDSRPASCLAFFKLLTARRRKAKDTVKSEPPTVPSNNRRASVRYTVGVGSAASIDPAVHAGGELESWPLVIRDISAGGIGLLLARRFELGTILQIEYSNGPDATLRKLSARVMRVQPEHNGHWVHGCAFLEPLAEDELAVLVQPGD
ncbi:MAG TPA: serine/threonine-protein kinase [Gemmata sp.]|nr:serine/threonine-protein kinase [Gemmata sp.]